MDLYITFYRKSNNILFVSNHFSFGRENLTNYTDIFIDLDSDKKSIKNLMDNFLPKADRVFISILSREELDILLPYLDHRWVISGTIYSYIFSEKKADFFNISPDVLQKNSTFTDTTIEAFLKKETSTYSSTFSYYFEPLIRQTGIKNLFFSCSLGRGCYWGKCCFCGSALYTNEHFVRTNIYNILNQIPPNTYGGVSQVSTGISSLTPEILEQILVMKWDPSIYLVSFLRADKKIIRTLEQFDSGFNKDHRMQFSIGAEILSDTALSILKKGITVEYILRTIDLLLDLGATVRLFIMKNFPFVTAEIVQEVTEGCRKLKNIVYKKNDRANRIWISCTGDIYWPNNVPKNLSVEFEKFHYGQGMGRSSIKNHPFYKAKIPPDSDLQRLNEVINQAVRNTGLAIVG